MDYSEFTEDEEYNDRNGELRYLVDGVPVRIVQDDDPRHSDPRDNTNVGTFVHWHRRYELGDEQISGRLMDAMDRGGMKLLTRYLTLVVGATVVIPVGLLDHSGLTIWAGGGAHWSDSAGWDSGTVGVIYDTPESREETGVALDHVEEALRSEIKEYDMYLRGEVYGYIVGDENLGVEESCWGFIGLKYVQEEAASVAKYLKDDIEAKRRMVAHVTFQPETLVAS